MPDYAETATPRYKVKYVAAGRQHSWTIRGNRGETQATTVGRGQNLATELAIALDDVLPDDFTFLTALYIPQDTNVSVGAGLPTQHVGLLPAEDFLKNHKIRHLTFPGKSSNGSVSHIQVYCPKYALETADTDPAADFILYATENANVAAAITALNARAVAGIDNGIVSFYPYATYNINRGWQKKVRKGA